MKKLFFSLLFAALVGGAFSGCANTEAKRDESKVPWARPAPWEGGAPGVLGDQGRTGY